MSSKPKKEIYSERGRYFPERNKAQASKNGYCDFKFLDPLFKTNSNFRVLGVEAFQNLVFAIQLLISDRTKLPFYDLFFAFLVGFLAAALEDKAFRHPRFLMIDITEDKGMEQERSHNFQQQVVRVSTDSEVEHQIILATAMPSPELDETVFVGKFSTRDNGTLAFLS